MSVTVTVTITSAVPAQGWDVQYRVKDSTGAYTTPVGSPYMVSPISFTTPDPPGTLYEVQVKADCGAMESTWVTLITPCNCTQAGQGSGGYAPTADGNQCVKTDPPVSATVSGQVYFLKPVGNTLFSAYGARIYTPGFNAGDIFWTTASNASGHIDSIVSTPTLWKNVAGDVYDGPMNYNSVWRSANGTVKDMVGKTSLFTLDFKWNNSSSTVKQVYIGVGCKSRFIVKVNGTSIVDTNDDGGYGNDYDTYPWKLWHLMPVSVIQGTNYFNVSFAGTGTSGAADDAVGVAIYNNTSAELKAASSTSDLSILWSTHSNIFAYDSQRPVPYDVATCGGGSSLDTSSGSSVCLSTRFDICNGTNQPLLWFDNKSAQLPGQQPTTFDIYGVAGTTFDAFLMMSCFLTGATNNVTASATASVQPPSSPVDLTAIGLSQFYPTPPTSISLSSSPSAIHMTIPAAGVIHMKTLANVQNGGSTNLNASFNVKNINGNSNLSDATNIWVGYSSS